MVHADEVLKDSSENYYSKNILFGFKAASAALWWTLTLYVKKGKKVWGLLELEKGGKSEYANQMWRIIVEGHKDILEKDALNLFTKNTILKYYFT